MQTTSQTTPATLPPTAAEHPAPLPAALTPRRRLATIKQIPHAGYPFTEAALRDIAFRAFDRKNSRGEPIQGNGLGTMGGILRLGRKVLVDLDIFEAWIAKRGGVQ